MKKWKFNLEKNKKDILILITIILVSICVCFNFLKMHYALDTYNLIEIGYKNYAKHFLGCGRLTCALYLLASGFLHLPIQWNLRISFFFGVLFMALAVFALYKTVRSRVKKEQRWIDFLLILSSSLVVFSFCASELLLFAESSSMGFSLLATVLSASFFVKDSKHHYLWSLLLIILAGASYQGVLSLFIPLVFLLLIFDGKTKIKEWFRPIVISGVFYAISYLLVLLMIKGFSSYFGIIGREVFIPSIMYIIKTFLSYGEVLLIDGLFVIPKYSYAILLTSIVICLLLILKKENAFWKNTLSIGIIIILCFFFSIFPLISMAPGEQYIEPRIAISYGSCLGLLFLYWLVLSKKSLFKVMTILLIFTFVGTIIYYIDSSSQMLITNHQDQLEAKMIVQEIEKYEKKTSILVENVVILFEPEITYYPMNVKEYKSMTYRAPTTTWSIPGVFIEYTGRRFHFIEPSEKDKLIFENQDDYQFDVNRQIKIIGNTLYYLVY